MIDILKYNKRESNYYVYCRLLEYMQQNYPHLLRNKNGTLRSPKECRQILNKIKNDNNRHV